jgi:ParB/RepB/Spo0J family partition protein
MSKPKTTTPAVEETDADVPVKLQKGAANVANIPVEQISEKKGFNPRKTRDEAKYAELKASVKRDGVLQSILVCPVKPGSDKYYVIAGHQRLDAAKETGKKLIPAIIKDVSIDSPEAYGMAYTENSKDARSDLTPEDEAAALAHMLELCGGPGNENEVAKRCGCCVATVKRNLKYLTVPKDVRKKVASGEISRNTALAVVDAPEEVRSEVIKKLGPGVGEKDVRVMINEAKADARKAGKAVTEKKSTTKTGEESRHNVPFGAAVGFAPIHRGQREQAEVRRRLTAVILNLELDVTDNVKGAKERLAEARGALAALYWSAGITKELVAFDAANLPAAVDLAADDFLEAFERGKEVVIKSAPPAADEGVTAPESDDDEIPAAPPAPPAAAADPLDEEPEDVQIPDAAPAAEKPKAKDKSKKKAKAKPAPVADDEDA